jgi:hypothetical protein
VDSAGGELKISVACFQLAPQQKIKTYKKEGGLTKSSTASSSQLNVQHWGGRDVWCRLPSLVAGRGGLILGGMGCMVSPAHWLQAGRCIYSGGDGMYGVARSSVTGREVSGLQLHTAAVSFGAAATYCRRFFVALQLHTAVG